MRQTCENSWKSMTITNVLAYIVRNLLDSEFIRVFLVCAALFGVHLVEPYLFDTLVFF